MKAFLAFFLLLALPAAARIGESLEECMKRYGSPVPREGARDDYRLVFSKNGFVITVDLDKAGKCFGIIYFRGSPAAPQGDTLAPDEIEVLKKANGGEAPWKETRSPVGAAWECESKQLRAYANGHILTIGTAEYFDREKERAKEKRIENLKDF